VTDSRAMFFARTSASEPASRPWPSTRRVTRVAPSDTDGQIPGHLQLEANAGCLDAPSLAPHKEPTRS
jgi:hypothetical protein